MGESNEKKRAQRGSQKGDNRTRWFSALVGYMSNKRINHISTMHMPNTVLKRVKLSSRDAHKNRITLMKGRSRPCKTNGRFGSKVSYGCPTIVQNYLKRLPNNQSSTILQQNNSQGKTHKHIRPSNHNIVTTNSQDF